MVHQCGLYGIMAMARIPWWSWSDVQLHIRPIVHVFSKRTRVTDHGQMEDPPAVVKKRQLRVISEVMTSPVSRHIRCDVVW